MIIAMETQIFTEQLYVTTFVPPLLSRCVVKLEVDLAVLSGLGPGLAVFCSLVGLVVDLCAECVGELFCGAAAFLTQVVTLPKVLAQVLIVTVARQKFKYKTSTSKHSSVYTNVWGGGTL